MEVKVDSNLIKTERENRGWSQEHLGNVAGLSLRTIQRIEKTGTASFESATALASVLALDLADLRASESQPSRPWTLRLSLELPLKLVLAAVSGILCGLHFMWSPSGLAWGWNFGWLDYGTGGTLFAVGVLCPYLRFGHGLVMRALGLIGASTLSYFCATMVALDVNEWFFEADLVQAFMLGSFIGVSIVLVAAKFLVPLRVTTLFWLLGVLVSLIGGAAMFAAFNIFDATLWSVVAGYCVWHMLACIALHHGRQPDDVHGGLLTEFARTRGRFSIVPGWLRLSHPAAAGYLLSKHGRTGVGTAGLLQADRLFLRDEQLFE